MTQEEGLKLALGYVERNCPALVFGEIKEALAQPEQEPVGSVVRWLDGSLVHGWFSNPPPEGTLLYITPPAAQPEERNFCPRCGKRTADLTTIHTCTPPQENT
jgi:hypothetical protein